MLLAGEAALRDCSGDAYAQDKTEEGKMAAALQSSFHAMDREVLQRARGEQEQDGATAVVILRTGMAGVICHVMYALMRGSVRIEPIEAFCQGSTLRCFPMC